MKERIEDRASVIESHDLEIEVEIESALISKNKKLENCITKMEGFLLFYGRT